MVKKNKSLFIVFISKVIINTKKESKLDRNRLEDEKHKIYNNQTFSIFRAESHSYFYF